VTATKGKLPALERLRELLAYDPETGTLTWRVSTSRRAPIGAEAGCLSKKSGYVLVRVDNVLHRAHRLVWKMVYEEEPGEIDHANGVRHDNRMANLRPVTRSQNNMNRRATSVHGKGVCFDKERGLFAAKIKLGGRQHNLGRFATAEAAAEAYKRAADEMFGEYARY
jgi:hypothetical protein